MKFFSLSTRTSTFYFILKFLLIALNAQFAFAGGKAKPLSDPSHHQHHIWKEKQDQKEREEFEKKQAELEAKRNKFYNNPPVNACIGCEDPECTQKFVLSKVDKYAKKLEVKKSELHEWLLANQPSHWTASTVQILAKKRYASAAEFLNNPPINPCKSCVNPDCNEKFAKSQAMATAALYQNCPCNDPQCLENFADRKIYPGLLKAQPAHKTVTKREATVNILTSRLKVAENEVKKAQSDLKDAETQYNKAVDVATSVNADPNSTQSTISLALSVLNIKKVAFAQSKVALAAAIQAFDTIEADLKAFLATETASSSSATTSQNCFAGETPVCVKDETSENIYSKPIESIQPDTYVLSCNLEMGLEACQCQQVKRLISNRAEHLIKFTFAGKILRTTENHLFYLKDRNDWVKAQDLNIGDKLVTTSGEVVPLDNIEHEYGDFKVYNLDLEGHSTYYASDVLVNSCDQ